MSRRRKHARLEPTPDGTGLAFFSSYNRLLVWELKDRIPVAERKWDPARKCWVVAAQHALLLAQLVRDTLGITIDVPAPIGVSATLFSGSLDVRYIGRIKNRDDGTESAFGWTKGGWNAIFTAQSLRTWFKANDTPALRGSLYAVLGLDTEASDTELKKAHRRAAKQWHPDVCHEPDAEAQFRRIQSAYEILSDPARRGRYNAGLALQGRLQQVPLDDQDFVPPLRCGLIAVEASPLLGRYIVERITKWDDITDTAGRTLVTSWKAGADHFTEEWF